MSEKISLDSSVLKTSIWQIHVENNYICNIIMCMLIKPKYLTISLKIDNKQHQECQRINPAYSTYSL